jgi:hypothetical protein
LPKVIFRIILVGAKVNEEDQEGYTPLMMACELCFPMTIKVLLKHKANANAIHNSTGNTPLHIVAKTLAPTALECAQLLIASGAISTMLNKDNLNAIQLAEKKKNSEVCNYLAVSQKAKEDEQMAKAANEDKIIESETKKEGEGKKKTQIPISKITEVATPGHEEENITKKEVENEANKERENVTREDSAKSAVIETVKPETKPGNAKKLYKCTSILVILGATNPQSKEKKKAKPLDTGLKKENNAKSTQKTQPKPKIPISTPPQNIPSKEPIQVQAKPAEIITPKAPDKQFNSIECQVSISKENTVS